MNMYASDVLTTKYISTTGDVTTETNLCTSLLNNAVDTVLENNVRGVAI